MSELLIEAGGGWRVDGKKELYECIKGVIEDEDLRRKTGRRARSFVEGNRGALGRVLGYIDTEIERSGKGR